jgi:hypothetical protein
MIKSQSVSSAPLLTRQKKCCRVFSQSQSRSSADALALPFIQTTATGDANHCFPRYLLPTTFRVRFQGVLASVNPVPSPTIIGPRLTWAHTELAADKQEKLENTKAITA